MDLTDNECPLQHSATHNCFVVLQSCHHSKILMNFNLKLDAKVNVIKSHNNDILQKGWCCSLWRVYCFDKLSLTNQLQDLPFQSRLKNISFMLFTVQVFYINCRWRILFYHLVKIFLSFFLQ